MHHAVRGDRLWFQQHPEALVRFRPTEAGEFAPLKATGNDPPAFRPSICRPNAPLRWVAVIDLMRLAGASHRDSVEATARLRLLIPAVRSQQRRQTMEDELLDAVSAELLAGFDANIEEQSAAA